MIPDARRIRNNRIAGVFVALAVAAGLGVCVRFGAENRHARELLWIGCVGAGVWTYRWWTGVLRRRVRLLKEAFPPEWTRFLEERVAYYTRLSDDEKERFRSMARIFLAETPIHGCGVEIDDETRLLVAASAIIPVFGFPEWEYDMLDEVLVYPHTFGTGFGGDAEEESLALGYVCTSGLANGVMILSKPELEHGFGLHGDRRNVGVHEFAHMVDKGDGRVDGVPAGMRGRAIRPWLEIVRAETEEAKRSGKSDIPDYAFTNEEEFFAVVTECFFESPDSLKRNHPDLYAMLAEALRQDPARRMRGMKRRIFRARRRRISRNDPCPCGSGKKYKHCCLRKKRGSAAR